MSRELSQDDNVGGSPDVRVSTSASARSRLGDDYRAVERLFERHSRVLGAIVLAVIFVALTAVYIHLSFSRPKSSDDASFVQEAQDILGGNILLRGWSIALDSFYTVVLPLYAIVGLLVPRLSLLLYLVNPIIYALTVIACLAIGWAYTEPRNRLIGMCLLFAVVALPSTLITDFNVNFIAHVSTVLCVLLTFHLIAADYSLVLAALPLVLAGIGDPLALYIGNIPLAVVGLWLGLKDPRHYLRLAVLAVSCVIVTKVALAMMLLAGGFKQLPIVAHFVSADQLSQNIYLFWVSILDLFGADFFGRDVFNPGTAAILVHAAVMILVIWLVCEACVRALRREENLMTTLLCASLVLTTIEFVFSDKEAGGARYLTTVPIFGALIAAMSWQRLIVRKYALYLLLPVVACAYFGAFAAQMFEPIAKPPMTVVKFLEENGLTEGYGSYWSSSILSVLSEGKIVVRQVGAAREGIVPLRWSSSEQWYAMKDARFLIYKDKAFGAGPYKAVTTWGPPLQIKQIDGYTVMIWDSPLHVPLQGDDFPP